MRSFTLSIAAILFCTGAASLADGVLGVGIKGEFPKPSSSGAPIEFQLWKWGPDAAGARS